MTTKRLKDGIYSVTHKDRAFIVWVDDAHQWHVKEIEYGNDEGLWWSMLGQADTLKEAKELIQGAP